MNKKIDELCDRLDKKQERYHNFYYVQWDFREMSTDDSPRRRVKKSGKSSAEITKDVENYLESGGKITKFEQGISPVEGKL